MRTLAGISKAFIVSAILSAFYLGILGVQAQLTSNAFILPEPPYSVESDPTAVTAADLDGDEDTDLAVTNKADDTVSVLLNDGDGTFTAVATPLLVGDEPVSVTAADLDSENGLDLAVTNKADDTVSVLLNDGDGTFNRESFSVVDGTDGVAEDPVSVIAANLDGINGPDLAVANFGGDPTTVSVLLNNGNGTFGNASEYQAGQGACCSIPTSITAADLNGDRDLDLAVAWAGNPGNGFSGSPGEQ